MTTSKSLIELDCDPELVFSSGLRNFAIPHLYSIILKREGTFKTRLFVFKKDEHTLCDYTTLIHSHKYIDMFTPLYGSVIDNLYVKTDDEKAFDLDAYKYSRLSDKEINGLIPLNFTQKLIMEKWVVSEKHIIRADHYHSISISGYTWDAAWIIEELMINELHDPQNICYLFPDTLPTTLDTTPMTKEDYKMIFKKLEQHGYILKGITLD